jgi:hypothetical protein
MIYFYTQTLKILFEVKMHNQDMYQAVFSLMQDNTDIMQSIDIFKQNSIDYENLDIDNLNALDERFYNFLLIFLRNTPDNLWISSEHRVKVYDILKEQLDAYTTTPTPFIKDKTYI